MKSRKLPVIVTTRESLCRSVTDKPSVIYIDELLYSQNHKEAGELLEKQGYILSASSGKHGVFFLRSQEPNEFHPQRHEIHDPYDIL